MKVYELERYLSEVPDGAEVKFIVGDKPATLKSVVIIDTDGDYEITLVLE